VQISPAAEVETQFSRARWTIVERRRETSFAIVVRILDRAFAALRADAFRRRRSERATSIEMIARAYACDDFEIDRTVSIACRAQS
jgi:hypothetical protein